jgi:hypothetical protein
MVVVGVAVIESALGGEEVEQPPSSSRAAVPAAIKEFLKVTLRTSPSSPGTRR